MDIITHSKNIGTVLGTASVVAYISGYLALRARAHALGTDPGFKLVDEAYVFAGFRFFFITFVVFLISAPAVLLIRWGAVWIARHVPTEMLHYAEWILLVLVALLTILSLKIVSVSGVLLEQSLFLAHGSGLHGAILGRENVLALTLTFASVMLATLSALWFQARLTSGKAHSEFDWVLGVIVAVQILMLPIYHGALFADRKVRVLAATPGTVQGIAGPLGIVDRTSEHVTVLGLNAEGNGRLATIKLEDLNGIPVERVISLTDFIGNILAGTRGSGPKRSSSLTLNVAMQIPGRDASKETKGGPAMVSQKPMINRGFFATLADYLKITFEGIGSLGDSVVDSGQVWVVDLDVSGKPSEPKQIGLFNDMAWPVVGPDGSTLYALRRGRIVRIGNDGRSSETGDAQLHWIKLLGVAKDGSVLGLISESGEAKPRLRLAPGGPASGGSSPASAPTSSCSPTTSSRADEARIAEIRPVLTFVNGEAGYRAA